MAGEIIRPSALPDRPNPVASEKVPVDNGVTVGGATIEKLVLAGRPTASQPEAEAGTDPLKAMTPLTTKQAIDAIGGAQFATTVQGALAESAVQPGDLGTAAFQAATDFATAAQGAKADTAYQPTTPLPSVNRGDWSAATAYAVNDRVQYANQTWIALVANTNVIPTEGATWSLLSASAGVADGAVTLPKLASSVYASQAEAEAGTDNVHLMTPLRTLQQGKKLGQLVNVRAYGAALDGLTDDTAAFQASLDDQGAVVVPYTSTGFVAGEIELGSGQRIVAEVKTKWKLPPAANYGVRVTAFSVSQDAVLENFWFDLADCPTTTTAIRFGTAGGNVYKFRAKSCDFWNCGEAIGDELHATNFAFDIAFEDCICVYTRGRQVNLRRTRGYTRLEDFKVDHTQNADQVTWEGIRLEDFIGANLLRVEVVGPVLPAWTFQAGATGLVLEGKGNGKATVWLRDVLVDNTRGPGIFIKDVFNLDVESLMGYQNLGTQLALWNITKSNISNVATVGATGLTNAPVGTPNIYMNGCVGVSAANVRADDATGNGLVLENCTDNNITNLRASGCGARGYVETGTSNRNVVLNARYSGNTDGNLIQSGAQSAHVAWIGNGGTFLASTTGAATT